MNQPKIYGFCPAGSKWETVHKSDFNAAKAAVPIRENTTDHTYHLISKDINLLEENPYFDVTQHFKIYDGTVGATLSSIGYDNYDKTNWNIKLHAGLYINGEAVAKKTFETFAERAIFEHEVDLIIKSINFSSRVSGETKVYKAQVLTSVGNIELTKSFADVPKSVTCDIYVENLGYPHDEGGVTTERVDGCENTKVYSIGYGNGLDVVSYVDKELAEISLALDSILAIQNSLIGGGAV